MSAALDRLLALPRFASAGAAAYQPGLDRMRALLAAMDNPERAFASVHVAGTNGKGSTASFVAAVAQGVRASGGAAHVAAPGAGRGADAPRWRPGAGRVARGGRRAVCPSVRAHRAELFRSHDGAFVSLLHPGARRSGRGRGRPGRAAGRNERAPARRVARPPASGWTTPTCSATRFRPSRREKGGHRQAGASHCSTRSRTPRRARPSRRPRARPARLRRRFATRAASRPTAEPSASRRRRSRTRAPQAG